MAFSSLCGSLHRAGQDVEFCMMTLERRIRPTGDAIEVAMHLVRDYRCSGTRFGDRGRAGRWHDKGCVSAASAYGEDLVDVIGAQSL